MKEVNIQIPEGYQVDEQNSTFTCIKFIKKEKIKNVITQGSVFTNSIDFRIGEKWAFSHIKCENEGHSWPGSAVSGHGASLFLLNNHWYTQDGKPVEGYLYYKP